MQRFWWCLWEQRHPQLAVARLNETENGNPHGNKIQKQHNQINQHNPGITTGDGNSSDHYRHCVKQQRKKQSRGLIQTDQLTS